MTVIEELLQEHTDSLIALAREYGAEYSVAELTTRDFATRLGLDWDRICRPVFDAINVGYLNAGMPPAWVPAP